MFTKYRLYSILVSISSIKKSVINEYNKQTIKYIKTPKTNAPKVTNIETEIRSMRQTRKRDPMFLNFKLLFYYNLFRK